MKYDGPYTTGDCVRSIKAIASADGRVIYIAPCDEEKKSPRRSRTPARAKAEQNVHPDYSTRRKKKQ